MIPHLAGRGGYFDLAEQYGIDAKIVAAMDVATTLAFAAGLEALSDAGTPAEAVCYDGLVHDFFATAQIFQVSRPGFKRACGALRTAFEG